MPHDIIELIPLSNSDTFISISLSGPLLKIGFLKFWLFAFSCHWCPASWAGHISVFSGKPEVTLHNFSCHTVDLACHCYYVRSVFLSTRYAVFGPHIRKSCVHSQYLRRGACCKQFRIRRSIVGHPTLILEDHLCSSQEGTFAELFGKVLLKFWTYSVPVKVEHQFKVIWSLITFFYHKKNVYTLWKIFLKHFSWKFVKGGLENVQK